MNMEFEDFVVARCEKELVSNKRYLELQEQSLKAYQSRDFEKYVDISTSIISLTEKLCYKLAYKDCMKILVDME